MQPFINQNLTFTAEETSPPTEIAPGKWETKHTARFQGGLVNMVFIYEEFDGTWLLSFAKPQQTETTAPCIRVDTPPTGRP